MIILELQAKTAMRETVIDGISHLIVGALMLVVLMLTFGDWATAAVACVIGVVLSFGYNRLRRKSFDRSK